MVAPGRAMPEAAVGCAAFCPRAVVRCQFRQPGAVDKHDWCVGQAGDRERGYGHAPG